jgi:hypothetical protein
VVVSLETSLSTLMACFVRSSYSSLRFAFDNPCRPASPNRCFTHFIGPAQKPSLVQAINRWAQK